MIIRSASSNTSHPLFTYYNILVNASTHPKMCTTYLTLCVLIVHKPPISRHSQVRSLIAREISDP